MSRRTDDDLLRAFAEVENRIGRELAVRDLVNYLADMAEPLGYEHMQLHSQSLHAPMAAPTPTDLLLPAHTTQELINTQQPDPTQPYRQPLGVTIIDMIGPYFPAAYSLRSTFERLTGSGVVVVVIVFVGLAQLDAGQSIGRTIPLLAPVFDGLKITQCKAPPNLTSPTPPPTESTNGTQKAIP
jgi:hypothetical protein